MSLNFLFKVDYLIFELLFHQFLTQFPQYLCSLSVLILRPFGIHVVMINPAVTQIRTTLIDNVGIQRRRNRSSSALRKRLLRDMRIHVSVSVQKSLGLQSRDWYITCNIRQN